MSDGQYSLINTKQMSSARAVRKVKRDRVVKELGLKKKQVKVTRTIEPDFKNGEMLMPDEERDYSVKAGACPECGAGPWHTMRRKPQGKKCEFFIACWRKTNCSYRTPAFPESKLAMRHWKLVNALQK